MTFYSYNVVTIKLSVNLDYQLNPLISSHHLGNLYYILLLKGIFYLFIVLGKNII